MLVNNVLKNYHKPCAKCGTIDNLTRHHLKYLNGKKTGEIEILCRACHDKIEQQYHIIGILSAPAMMRKGTPENNKLREEKRWKKYISSPHFQKNEMRNPRDRAMLSLRMAIMKNKRNIKKHKHDPLKILPYKEKVKKYQEWLDFYI
jgi:hypothetical protein